MEAMKPHSLRPNTCITGARFAKTFLNLDVILLVFLISAKSKLNLDRFLSLLVIQDSFDQPKRATVILSLPFFAQVGHSVLCPSCREIIDAAGFGNNSLITSVADGGVIEIPILLVATGRDPCGGKTKLFV
jgi:hypothetical protein